MLGKQFGNVHFVLKLCNFSKTYPPPEAILAWRFTSYVRDPTADEAFESCLRAVQILPVILIPFSCLSFLVSSFFFK